MKKLLAVILCCVTVFLLCSCFDSNYVIEGIENFSTGDGSIELNDYILPSEDFIEKFENTDIQYRYYGSLHSDDRSIVAITYTQDVYKQAKEYCLEEMVLSDSMIMEYNGYTFIENVELPIVLKEYGRGLPHHFNMFVYNDTLNRLIFLGAYLSDFYKATPQKTQDVVENWGAFVETYFSDIYDWGTITD